MNVNGFALSVRYKPQARSTRLIQGVMISVVTLVPIGCKTENETSSYDLKVENEKVIQEQLDNTHARIAAYRDDVCPKLLMAEVDRYHIERENEKLLSAYCDYYLYPDIGQRITVNTDDDTLEVLLVTPYTHNFADGSVIANTTDKYVIRVKYNGMYIQPNTLEYDIDVEVR